MKSSTLDFGEQLPLSWKLNMSGKKLFLALAVGAVLLLQAADCVSAMAPDQQSMKCCGSMPCSPTNKTQGCCKSMISAPVPSMIVKARVSISTPPVVAVRYASMAEFVRRNSISPATLEVQQDSPPKLYTLHVALLI
jgi:hypothetical protein